MSTCIIIPARYASTRYPGKPLAKLTGRDGTKTLLQRSWEKASTVAGVERVVVATDDHRIKEHAEADLGAEVVMTSFNCENGTERCSEAMEIMTDKYDLYVNFQGDAPMTPAWFVEGLIKAMQERKDVDVATPILSCDKQTYGHFVKDRQQGRVGGTTAVFAADMTALYFSKEVLPYIDPAKAEQHYESVFHHVGVYAYRPEALRSYSKLAIGKLEAMEGLEQLRFLENGHTILCVPVDAHGELFWELNNPIDVQRIEEYIK
jgi:3-deoxy-manno-octulosonate cytidylyltransferase (CMP-KDO synthetase)